MIATATVTTVAITALVVLVAWATNGIAGFGFAVVGTMALATVMDPAGAVVFMIIPILAVNASLVRELSRDDLRSCGRRFWPLIGAALFGTIVGMAVLDRLPEAPLRVGLGVVTLGFVVTAQRRFPLPDGIMLGGSELLKTKPGMAAVGGVSGALFGGTNVGVQFVAYLRSFGHSYGLFVGVVALVFVGISGVRVIIAGVLGLYPSPTVLIASVAAAVPAVVGVDIGKLLRERTTE